MCVCMCICVCYFTLVLILMCFICVYVYVCVPIWNWLLLSAFSLLTCVVYALSNPAALPIISITTKKKGGEPCTSHSLLSVSVDTRCRWCATVKRKDSLTPPGCLTVSHEWGLIVDLPTWVRIVEFQGISCPTSGKCLRVVSGENVLCLSLSLSVCVSLPPSCSLPCCLSPYAFCCCFYL